MCIASLSQQSIAMLAVLHTKDYGPPKTKCSTNTKCTTDISMLGHQFLSVQETLQ